MSPAASAAHEEDVPPLRAEESPAASLSIPSVGDAVGAPVSVDDDVEDDVEDDVDDDVDDEVAPVVHSTRCMDTG